MSVIGTIQRKFLWLLIILLALAMLAFVLMDSSGPGGMQPGANKKVATINGDKVKAIDWQNKMKALSEQYQNATPDQIRSTAWNQLIVEKIFNPRFTSLGIGSGKEELVNQIMSDDPHPIAMQYFQGLSPEGYDPAAIQTFLEERGDKNDIVKQLYDLIREDVTQQKYSDLLQKGVNTPTWLASIDQAQKNKSVSFDFVQLPYSLISDDEVPVTDSELKEFASKNKHKYAADAGFVLQYVPFDILPSKEDSTKIISSLAAMKDRFATTSNPFQFASSQSASISNQEAAINPSLQWNTASTMKFSEEQNQKIISSNAGDIVGPFQHNGLAYLVNVVETSTVADSARVRHILLKTDGSDFAVKQALADSLTIELKQDKSKFEEYVTQYSEDQGSVGNGGEYDFFPQGQMVPEFNNASFTNAIGDIEVVQTQFGFHIIEVLQRKGNAKAVNIAPIIKRFTPSSETRKQISMQAITFERENKSKEAFLKSAEELGGAKTSPLVKPNATSIPGLGSSMDIISWANANSTGAVKLFTNIDNKDVVVRIESKQEKGQVNIEQNRQVLTNELLKQKKAEKLTAQIDQAGGSTQTLSMLANKLGRTVQQASNAKFGASGEGVGFEPELISTLFFKPEGIVPEIIEGRNGLYVVEVKQFTSDNSQPMAQTKERLNNLMSRRGNVSVAISELEEKGIIKDERYKLYQ